MLAMDQIHHIGALYYEQGYNISEIAKATGRDWKTVAKYIDMTDFNEPLPVPESEVNGVRPLFSQEELYRFYGRTVSAPSRAVFCKQRQKLSEKALPTLSDHSIPNFP